MEAGPSSQEQSKKYNKIGTAMDDLVICQTGGISALLL